jgi:hypothetical protein
MDGHCVRARVCSACCWGAVGGWQDIGFNKLTQVQPGMAMLQVLVTLGPPSDIRGNTFIYSMTAPEIAGKVVFESKGSPLDSTKVLKVEPSPLQQRFK